MSLHNTSSAISVRSLWKVFGDNPEKIVGSVDANLSKSDLRAKTGNTAAVKDVSFDDGLLTIKLNRVIPEHQKKKVYEIVSGVCENSE